MSDNVVVELRRALHRFHIHEKMRSRLPAQLCTRAPRVAILQRRPGDRVMVPFVLDPTIIPAQAWDEGPEVALRGLVVDASVIGAGFCGVALTAEAWVLTGVGPSLREELRAMRGERRIQHHPDRVHARLSWAMGDDDAWVTILDREDEPALSIITSIDPLVTEGRLTFGPSAIPFALRRLYDRIRGDLDAIALTGG